MSTLHDFMNSSACRETRWYADQKSNEVVGFCPSCKAELRLSTDGPSELRFAHNDSCPHSDEKRAQRLLDEMITVLEEETDKGVAISAVEFLQALLCVDAAEEAGVSLEVMKMRFVRALEQRIDDVEPVRKLVSAAKENAA